VLVATCEVADGRGGILAAPHLEGKSRKLQSCGPAFGALLQCAHVLCLQVKASDIGQQGGGLGGGEAQIFDGQLGELSLDP